MTSPEFVVPNVSDRSLNIGDVFRKTAGKIGLCLALGLSGNAAVEAIAAPESASAAQAVVGMPFNGKWAYNTFVSPPYTDVNSSHPSVHHRYYGDWATDLYAGAGTPVKLKVSSSDGPVTFTYNRSHDTCSSSGPNVAGHGIVLNVLINGNPVGSIDYEHLDNIPSGPYTEGMTIGTVTNEALSSNCYSVRHAHIELLNNSLYSCWVDRGSPGTNLALGEPIGVIGSANTGPQQACSPTPNIPSGSSSAGSQTIGLYNPANGVFYERNSNTPGPADMTVPYGNANWIPLAGDWNNDGYFTPGAYDPSTGRFYLSNSNITGGPADTPSFVYGNTGWIPIAGDWDGNGYWSIGMYDPGTSTFYLRNENSAGNADYTFSFGNTGWKPVTGDWDGRDDGNPATSVGVYNPNTATFYLNYSNDSSPADLTIQYGNAGWTPLGGDWNGDGFATIGAYDPISSTFYLRNFNSPGPADMTAQYGNVGWKPLTGDWDGK